MTAKTGFPPRPVLTTSERLARPVTPELIVALTRHLKINGRPFESTLHRMDNIGRGVSWDRPDVEPES